MFEELV